MRSRYCRLRAMSFERRKMDASNIIDANNMLKIIEKSCKNCYNDAFTLSKVLFMGIGLD